MSSQVVRVRVPAKVNLHLAVGPLRPDGYHELVTVFHAVALYDEVVAAPADELSLTVSGRADGVPTDVRNLAWRAAELLATATGVEPRVALHLDKAIPVAGGMAGGSADAAGALLACARLWGVDADLPALAAELGSDTVFPLLGGTAVGTGRGEVLRPVPCGVPLHWVLAFASDGISAGDAYRELDRQRAVDLPAETGAGAGDGRKIEPEIAAAADLPATNGAGAGDGRKIEPEIAAAADLPAETGAGAGDGRKIDAGSTALLAALETGDVSLIAAHLHNDLQPAVLALRPELAETLHAGRDACAGIVSGSGPTCAFLCADEAHALAVADRLRALGYEAVASTGPAAGATVVS